MSDRVSFVPYGQSMFLLFGTLFLISFVNFIMTLSVLRFSVSDYG